jgi:uncharacterized protein (TIGR01777 family)
VSISVSSIVSSPIEDVFAWHERTGALARLLPPWQPIRIKREAANLRNGRAELWLPGGFVWAAIHEDYDRPYRFADRLSSLPLRWRHEHRFEPLGTAHTRVVDEVGTPVPSRVLQATFAYRHRQLHGDLLSHAWARRLMPAPLTVAITGASGLVGTALAAFLSTGGHRVIRLVRRAPLSPDERQWSPEGPHPELLRGTDALVHLAGAPIFGRFSAEHKARIYESRVGPTRQLARLAAKVDDGPRVFVSASAIGYYGPDRGDELLHDGAEKGEGFLATVVADWESATEPAADAGVRVVNVRTGIVQSPRGGALRLLCPLFLAGLGGPVGQGEEWMSWIGLDDLLDVYLRALVDARLDGPVNAVAPNPVRARDYARTLGRTLHRPALVQVPVVAPQVLLGPEGSRELALASERVLPDRLMSLGHPFRQPELGQALAHALGKAGFPDDVAEAEACSPSPRAAAGEPDR